ncbi:MAG TPA: quinol:electron acceptor oxidoreductase subunit ActD [Bryobacteraceae bacterium]|nr:quinol:electron acceptor oxidoreductase subunit ActD [Bryobacteraceae bacterium]
MSNTAVFGIYRDTVALGSGLEALRAAAFRSTDVSVLMPENLGTKDFGHQKATKAPEGATAGATTGAVLGGALGWLVGVGALAIPGLGPFIAAGPIMGMLAGAGAAGVVGGIAGSLIGMGIPEYEAKRYEGRVKSGSILLSVHCDNSEWVKRAKNILERTGAEDISSAGEAAADFAVSGRPSSRL